MFVVIPSADILNRNYIMLDNTLCVPVCGVSARILVQDYRSYNNEV